jgi:hypothetical protein
MSLTKRKAYKALAVFLAFAFAQVYVQTSFAELSGSRVSVPVPQQFVARLTTRANQPITVNGASAASGATILTGATIETPDQVGATINLGDLGTLDLAPNTKVMLEFDDNGHVRVKVLVGCVVYKACKNCKKDVDAEIDTPAGPAAKSDKKKNGGAMDVCFPGSGTPVVNAGAAASAGAGAGGGATAAGGGGLAGGGLSTAAKIAIFGGIGGTTATLIYALRGHNPSP